MIGGQLPIPARGPGDANRAADRILAEREYYRPPKNLFERAQEKLAELIGRLFENLTGGGFGAVVGWVLLVGGLVAIVWLVTRTGRTMHVDRTIKPVEVMIELTRTPGEWRDEADRLETAGDFRGGIRARYRALVADFVAAGLLSDLPGRTSGEYRREVDASGIAQAPQFAEATDLFERAWYGDEPTGSSERDRMVALALAISGAAA